MSATRSIVSFPNTQLPKLKVTPHAATNSEDASDIANLRKKVTIVFGPQTSAVPINNNDSTSNNKNIISRDFESCDSRVKKKTFRPFRNASSASSNQLPTVAVARRNARERNRVQQVNHGFDTLRQHIPASVALAFASAEQNNSREQSSRGGNKKLSKVETLRMAVEYIRSLQHLLATGESDNSEPSVTSPKSFASTSPSPSTMSQNQSHNNQNYVQFEEDTREENSSVIHDDDLINNYDEIESQASSEDNVTDYSRRLQGTSNLSTNSEADNKNFMFMYEVNRNIGTASPFASSNNSSPPIRDQRMAVEFASQGEIGGYGCMDDIEAIQRSSPIRFNSSAIGHHPTASLSPGVYSEQSLSPAEIDIATARMMYLPSFSRTLRQPLSAGAVESVIQQTYHLMQQMPVKEEASENVACEAGDENVGALEAWWEYDRRLRGHMI